MASEWQQIKTSLSGAAASHAANDPVWAIAFALMELASNVEDLRVVLEDAKGDLAEGLDGIAFQLGEIASAIRPPTED